MSQARFNEIMGQIATVIGDRPIDAALYEHLSKAYAADSPFFKEVESLCAEGEKDGWLCAREQGGIKFGRCVKPGGVAGRFSVDVVRMNDVKGPHHAHPNGEIGMIMPVSGNPTFDGFPRGWYVDPPGSDHWPTVAGGGAYVLYLLPEGAIQFTGK
jgi:hypothetical protein